MHVVRPRTTRNVARMDARDQQRDRGEERRAHEDQHQQRAERADQGLVQHAEPLAVPGVTARGEPVVPGDRRGQPPLARRRPHRPVHGGRERVLEAGRLRSVDHQERAVPAPGEEAGVAGAPVVEALDAGERADPVRDGGDVRPVDHPAGRGGADPAHHPGRRRRRTSGPARPASRSPPGRAARSPTRAGLAPARPRRLRPAGRPACGPPPGRTTGLGSGVQRLRRFVRGTA